MLFEAQEGGFSDNQGVLREVGFGDTRDVAGETMTNRIVFVLHSAADKEYAAELAGALVPLPAFPVPLLDTCSGRGVQFGAGALCVVVWTQELHQPELTDAALVAVAGAVANFVIFRAGAQPPEALRLRAFACLPEQGEVAADANRLREGIAAHQRQTERQDEFGRRAQSPQIGRPARPEPQRGRRSMAVRSAYGLAVTLAVVGVAAPVIAGRTGSTNAEPDSAAPRAAAAAPVPAATDAALAAEEAMLIESSEASTAPPLSLLHSATEMPSSDADDGLVGAPAAETGAFVPLPTDELDKPVAETVAGMPIADVDGVGAPARSVDALKREAPRPSAGEKLESPLHGAGVSPSRAKE